MKIGNVIRKYRKEAGLTQEEMANRLGVTTPAVNKWENGVCNPDIELLAPIASEEIRRHAADSLFGFYLRKKDYAKAEEYLQYFNDHDPMKQIYQGRLYKEHGKTDEACEAFENVLFSSYNTLNFAFSFLTTLAIEEHDMEKARFLAEKMGALAALFEMGKYHECSAMLDVVCAEKNREETYRVVEQLLKNVDSLCDFQKSKLFAHMKYRNSDSSFTQGLKEKLKDGFREESCEYMRGHEGWEKLLQ